MELISPFYLSVSARFLISRPSDPGIHTIFTEPNSPEEGLD
jgi:hypothetical protein